MEQDQVVCGSKNGPVKIPLTTAVDVGLERPGECEFAVRDAGFEACYVDGCAAAGSSKAVPALAVCALALVAFSVLRQRAR